MSSFSGIWIPLVTPFSNGAVDHSDLRALVRSYADTGISGFVALGTTGEPASLSDAEQRAVLSTILDAACGLPVVAGLAGNNTAELHARVAELNTLPLAGLLVPAPYYVRPSQQGVHDHFITLAGLSAHPLIVYDIPYRTGVRIELPTLLSLAAHPNIVAIKDCAGSLETTLAGRLGEAREAFHRIVPLIQALVAEPNPAPVKAALSILGEIDPELRTPMTRASDATFNRLRGLLAEQDEPQVELNL